MARRQLLNLKALAVASESDLTAIRGFGRKSLTEIRDIISERNLTFGMDVAKYRLDED